MMLSFYLLCVWMAFVGASVSDPTTDPSSRGHQRISTPILASAATAYVEKPNIHVVWDKLYWSSVSHPTAEMYLINTEPWADSSSVADTKQIRPTSSSEYLKITGTSSDVIGVSKRWIETLTEEIVDAATYFGHEMLPSILTEYIVSGGSENDHTVIDYDVFWSNPDAISDVTLVNMGADDMDSLVDLSESYLVGSESFTVMNALEVTAILDDYDLGSSGFEVTDLLSTFQDDHSFSVSAFGVTTLPFSNGDNIKTSESIDSFSTRPTKQLSSSNPILLEVNTVSKIDESDRFASVFEFINSSSISQNYQNLRSDKNLMETTLLTTFDDYDFDTSGYESIDSVSTRPANIYSDVSTSATTEYGNYVSLSHSNSDTPSGNATSTFGNTTSDNATSILGNTTSDNATSTFGNTTSDNATSTFGNTTSDNVISTFGNTTSDNATSTFGNTTSDNVTSSLGNTTSDNATSIFENTSSDNATSTSENTTYAADNITSGSVTESPMCQCDCHYAANLKLYRNATAVNITSDEVQKELKKQVTSLQKELTLNKTNLSSAKRKKTSMNDDRASARGVGLIGVAMLVLLMGGLVLMDLTTIKRDFQRLKDNLGYCCKEKKSAC